MESILIPHQIHCLACTTSIPHNKQTHESKILHPWAKVDPTVIMSPSHITHNHIKRHNHAQTTLNGQQGSAFQTPSQSHSASNTSSKVLTFTLTQHNFYLNFQSFINPILHSLISLITSIAS